MAALDHAVRQGKALYAGISSYSRRRRPRRPPTIARDLGTPLLIHQPSYSMLNRWIEGDLLDELEEQGMGCIVFTALAQGLLTDRYLDGVPGGLARRPRGSTTAGLDERRAGPGPRAERDRARPRPEAGPAGAPVGAARPAGHLGRHRRVVGRAARHQPRRPRRAGLDRRGARRDRPGRRRLRRSTSGRRRRRTEERSPKAEPTSSQARPVADAWAVTAPRAGVNKRRVGVVRREQATGRRRTAGQMKSSRPRRELAERQEQVARLVVLLVVAVHDRDLPRLLLEPAAQLVDDHRPGGPSAEHQQASPGSPRGCPRLRRQG